MYLWHVGYQRELTFRHYDGSYSAFGKSDNSGSMWLTAFVVKSFAQARQFVFIDPAQLTASIGWIRSKQLENGCFPQVGGELRAYNMSETRQAKTLYCVKYFPGNCIDNLIYKSLTYTILVERNTKGCCGDHQQN